MAVCPGRFTMVRWWWLVLGILAVVYLAVYTPATAGWNKATFVRRIYTKDDFRIQDTSGKDGFSSIQPCSRRHNVAFLKTHKCASSTVQNIFLRYANSHNLTVVLPTLRNTHYLSRLVPFSRAMVNGAIWGKNGYNILCHHMIFNQTEVELLMPKDTVYISIVRDPVSLFESLYEYDDMAGHYKMDIDTYAEASQNASTRKVLLKRAGGNLGRNQMLFDFGVPTNSFDNESSIIKAIERIDKRFNLVMVAELFDESIVLMKHLLCWDLDDVISFTVNARMRSFKKNLSEETVSRLRKWNFADQLLYDHFAKRLRKQIEEFGPDRMAYEVQELRKRRLEWFHTCVDREGEARGITKFRVWSNKVLGFHLKPEMAKNRTCEDLVKPERLFTSQLRQQQTIRSLPRRDGRMRFLNWTEALQLSQEKTLKIVRQHLKALTQHESRFTSGVVKSFPDQRFKVSSLRNDPRPGFRRSKNLRLDT